MNSHRQHPRPLTAGAIITLAALVVGPGCGDDGAGSVDASRRIDGRIVDARATPGADAVLVDGPVLDAPPPAIDASACASGPFLLDGVLDPSAQVLAGGGTSIRLAVAVTAAGLLYVATDDAGEGSDHFVLVTDSAPGVGTGSPPFAKAGTIARSGGLVLALADENDNDFAGWFELPPGGGDVLRSDERFAQATGGNGGVIEGVVDLEAITGTRPAMVYLAAAPYLTPDAGALVAAAQTPAGNGDGNVDAGEYLAVVTSCP
jgi:hypothetical protein